MARTWGVLLLALPGVLTMLGSCVSGGGGEPSRLSTASPAVYSEAGTDASATAAFPLALPLDRVQPWERLDASGNVIAAASPPPRSASAFSPDGLFAAGVERFSDGGSAAELGEALRLESGVPGSEAFSHALYRFSVGQFQPGTMSFYINPLQRGDGQPSRYWVATSDYKTGRWRWRGPYSHSLLRLGLGAGEYASELGNMYIAVLVYGGDRVDVVGAGLSLRGGGDQAAPPVPGEPQLTALAGSVLVEWVPVVAADIAGYRVYYANETFPDGNTIGVPQLQRIVAEPRVVLPATGELFVRIAAVDVSGNLSDTSVLSRITPLAGSPPQLFMEAAPPSGLIGDPIEITVSGAELYDFDLNGDGIYEATSDSDGVIAVPTLHTGLLRPLVRGRMAGGATAFASANMIVAGSSRPVADGSASPTTGQVPLAVQFSGEGADADGEIVLYNWDFDGDGFMNTPAVSTPTPRRMSTD